MPNQPDNILGKVCVVLKNGPAPNRQNSKWTRAAIKNKSRCSRLGFSGVRDAIEQWIRWEILANTSDGHLKSDPNRVTVSQSSWEHHEPQIWQASQISMPKMRLVVRDSLASLDPWARLPEKIYIQRANFLTMQRARGLLLVALAVRSVTSVLPTSFVYVQRTPVHICGWSSGTVYLSAHWLMP